VARVVLGPADTFRDTPFFWSWSAHYETTINYVGHAEAFDTVDVEGNVADGRATVRLKKRGLLFAAATLGRDLDLYKRWVSSLKSFGRRCHPGRPLGIEGIEFA
jgi:hypothetical protein